MPEAVSNDSLMDEIKVILLPGQSSKQDDRNTHAG